MSTPTGRPFTPVSISDYAPKKVRERAALQGGSTAGDGVDRPPGAPMKPRQDPAEAHPADDADDHHETPLAPTGPHEPPADERGEGEHPPPFGPQDARQDEAAEDGLSQGDYDHDLSLLESRLQQLRRERAERTGEETRLPRAGRLGLRPDAFGRDAYIDGFRLPRSLGPTFVPPPPLREERTSHLGLALRVAVACAIAAPVAYYFSAGGSVAPRKSDKGPMLSSAESRVVELTPGRAASARAAPPQATPPQAAQPQALPPQALPPQAAQVPVAQKQVDQVPAVGMPVAPMPAPQPVAGPDEARPDTAPPAHGDVVGMSTAGANRPAPVAKPVRAIDAEAVKLLLTQGEQFVNAGDLVTARLLFRRAAEAGDAAGALALGATYDPGVLAKLGVRGISADADEARSWYEKARDLGSPEAARRLKILANR